MGCILLYLVAHLVLELCKVLSVHYTYSTGLYYPIWVIKTFSIEWIDSGVLIVFHDDQRAQRLSTSILYLDLK